MHSFLRNNILHVVSFNDIFAVSLIIPMFSTYLKDRGFTPMDIGAISSVYSIIQFLSSPIVGYCSDIYGSRHILILTLCFCGVCYSGLGLIASSFTTILILRAVTGFFKHTQLLCRNIIQERSDVLGNLGKLSAASSLGFILGPAICGYFMKDDRRFPALCIVTGFIFFANAFLAWSYIRERGGKRNNKNNDERKAADAGFGISKIPWSLCWDLFALRALNTVSFFSFLTNLSWLSTNKYEASPVHLGYTFSMHGFIGVVSALGVERLNTLLPGNSYHKISLGFGVMFSSFLWARFSPNFSIFICSTIPLIASVSFLRITCQKVLCERITGSERRGLLMGMFANATAASKALLPAVTGVIMSIYGEDSIYILAVGSSFLGLLLSTWFWKNKSKTD